MDEAHFPTDDKMKTRSEKIDVHENYRPFFFASKISIAPCIIGDGLITQRVLTSQPSSIVCADQINSIALLRNYLCASKYHFTEHNIEKFVQHFRLAER